MAPVLKETRPFPMVSDCPTHLHQDTYENFLQPAGTLSVYGVILDLTLPTMTVGDDTARLFPTTQSVSLSVRARSRSDTSGRSEKCVCVNLRALY